ncbi:MAG: P1 family peptidase [Calditrichia bacterium]
MKMITIPTKRLKIGTAEDEQIKTGCHVFLFPEGANASVDIRGGAPGTRETALLGPDFMVEQIHGLVFTGGSAFGLAAADGVMRYLHEKQIGFKAGTHIVPIVPAAVIFDLDKGKFGYPVADMGYRAAQSASQMIRVGKTGSGIGATVGKAFGMEYSMDGGFGTYLHPIREDVWVMAFATVNALGDIWDSKTGKIIAGARNKDGSFFNTQSQFLSGHFGSPISSNNTTLVLVVTNAKLSKTQLSRVAKIAQNGIGRAIRPSHTMFDGDIVFAVSTAEKEMKMDVSLIGECAAFSVEQAILSAVLS